MIDDGLCPSVSGYGTNSSSIAEEGDSQEGNVEKDKVVSSKTKRERKRRKKKKEMMDNIIQSGCKYWLNFHNSQFSSSFKLSVSIGDLL